MGVAAVARDGHRVVPIATQLVGRSKRDRRQTAVLGLTHGIRQTAVVRAQLSLVRNVSSREIALICRANAECSRSEKHEQTRPYTKVNIGKKTRKNSANIPIHTQYNTICPSGDDSRS